MSIAAKLVLLIAVFVGGMMAGIKWHAGQDAIKENARLELVRETERANRATEKQQAAQVIGAINASRKREQAAKAAADSLAGELDGLRDDLQSSRNDMSGATADACRQHAATLSGLLNQCAAAYSDMAGKAQGHAGDALTLEQSWPKPSQP